MCGMGVAVVWYGGSSGVVWGQQCVVWGQQWCGMGAAVVWYGGSSGVVWGQQWCGMGTRTARAVAQGQWAKRMRAWLACGISLIESFKT